MNTNTAQTLLAALNKSFEAALRLGDGAADPVALLWTDADSQWLPLIPVLRAAMPELYTYGGYDPDTRTGPAIWLKCIVDRTLPDAPPPGKTPVLYLPGVSRQELRAAADCPPSLQPLVELQFRGKVWHQANGHDWTVRAFLVSDGGLGLDVAADRRTEDAFLRVLPLLAEVDLRTLKGRRLDSNDFDKLSVQDPVRDFLRWLDNPSVFEAATKGPRWESFRGLCQSEFGLDPQTTPASEVTASILAGDSRMDAVWQRFSESPQLYAGVANALRAPSATGQGALALDASRDPRINDRDETELRKALEAMPGVPHGTACERVLELETLHRARRDWVWAKAGMSPWAQVLRPLATLARAARIPLGGASLAAAAEAYADSGWQCDRAAMEALAFFRNGGEADVVAKVVRALYETWLDQSARHFQSLVAREPAATVDGVGRTATGRDKCLVFVDGLRFDLAGQLAAKLEARSLRVSVSHRLSPLPTVTPSAKVAATPIFIGVKGDSGEGFAPSVLLGEKWKPVTADVLRERLTQDGLVVFDAADPQMPAGANEGAWTECGEIDGRGHKLGADLVHQLETELDRIADRVFQLLSSGWRAVRVVTDHGWLLLPGGLPKVDLPPYLTETKWARCALVKGESPVQVPESAWHWNSQVRIASPPGIACFRRGETYAHGGISPQECVIPELTVERGGGEMRAAILSIEWRGMRCRVRVDSNEPAVRVDLRQVWRDASTSIVSKVKEIGDSGEVSLAVDRDDLEGGAAFVVLLGPDGTVLKSQTTCVGETA